MLYSENTANTMNKNVKMKMNTKWWNKRLSDAWQKQKASSCLVKHTNNKRYNNNGNRKMTKRMPWQWHMLRITYFNEENRQIKLMLWSGIAIQCVHLKCIWVLMCSRAYVFMWFTFRMKRYICLLKWSVVHSMNVNDSRELRRNSLRRSK